MSDYPISADDILKATNGGLDIIIQLYPDAYDSVRQPKRMFKRRDESTASAKLNLLKSGNYNVVDFGVSKESLGAIELYMSEMGVGFGQAIQQLAQRYNVMPEQRVELKAKISSRPAGTEDTEGEWKFEVRESFTDNEIEYLVSKNVLKELKWKHKNEDTAKKAYAKIAGVFKYYNWHSLLSYSIVKDRKVVTFASTADYPIFLIDEGTHKKIYQPKHADKKYRFMYSPGSSPKDFIHGYKQLEAEYNKRKKEAESDVNDQAEDEDHGAEISEKSKKDIKIKKLALVSGGSDAINVALIGYQVIWLNSESAKLQEWQYKKIMVMVEKLYQLMDIDTTGKEQAHERAMQFLDLLTIELPDDLLNHTDSRGYKCKDVRDQLNIADVSEFHKLVEVALPYRFWDEKYMYTREGKFKGIGYDFNNVHAYNFLQKNGFFRIPVGNKETDFEYIKVTGNTVKKTTPIKIKAFIKYFLQERSADVALRNAIFRTTQLSDSSLTNLDEIELDFTDFTPHSQFMFFRNRTLEITAAGLKSHNPKTIKRFIWESDVYDHRFELLKEPPFEIIKDEVGGYDIKINNYGCLFLRFMIQTSRIHWRAELEKNMDSSNLTPLEREKYKVDNLFKIDGPLLSAEEIEEQKSHLINKIFCLGYLLHRYKNKSKAWMVLGMDGKNNHDGQSHGGSGKSIFLDTAMRTLLKNNFMLLGRNTKLEQDPHKYDGLTEHHRYIFIEDAHQQMNFDIFYTDITGDVKVNPKGKQPYVIPFAQAGKFSMSTNYTPNNLGPSTERRIIYTVFSDYYHVKGETTDYRESRDPSSEFGKLMFDEFTEEEWNLFYNTAAYALSFFLTTKRKLSPAMDNVNVRNLTAAMGPNFLDWASTYFAEESDKLNVMIIREEAYRDFMYHNPKSGMTAHGWKERLSFFCRLNGYVLNPTRYQSKKGPIIKKVEQRVYDARNNVWSPVEGQQKAKEMIFIQTPEFELMDEFKVIENPYSDLMGFPENLEDLPEDQSQLDF